MKLFQKHIKYKYINYINIYYFIKNNKNNKKYIL
jgi:hypothetical protein